MMPRRIKAVLIDLSGTLHVGSKVIEGSVEAVHSLLDEGIRIRYLTNTSTVSSASLLEQLRSFGFPVASREEDRGKSSMLMTSVLATCGYLKRHSLRPFCLTEDTSDFQNSGIPLATSVEEATAVVVGLAPSHFQYQRLNDAFRTLNTKPESELIAIHRSLHVKDEDGMLSLGPGGFVACLEAASGKRAKVMGKPSTTFFLSAMWDDIDPQEIAMIGDGWNEDMIGAQGCAVGHRFLVKTGKYQLGDEHKCDESVQLVDSVVVAIDRIHTHNRA